jgi:hypothetical protein
MLTANAGIASSTRSCFSIIQHLLVALMQGSLGHCPELVEVKFFFLVQLAEMSKKELLTRPTAGLKAVRFNSPRGRLVASAPSNSLPKQKRREARSFR